MGLKMDSERPTSKQIRDRICDELYIEIGELGFSKPKAGKLHYLNSTDRHWKIYLEIHVSQRWGEYNVEPMFIVNWSRIRELRKEMEPELNHDHFLIGITFQNLMTARIPLDDQEAWKNVEDWDELYVPETGDIEPVLARILDIFSRYGISFLRDWSNKETARQFVMKYGSHTAWHWLTAFALIMETKGTEEACRWLRHVEDPNSIYGQEQVDFLRANYCRGVSGAR